MAVMTGLPDNWLEVAASHGTTKWVKLFIRTFLPRLKDGEISAEGFASALEERLLARGLVKLAQQKNYRSNVVQAIKAVWLEHEAIALVAPTAEEYRLLNEVQRGRLADRETRFFTSEQAEVLVERARALLASAEWSEVGAGLAVLIGRRISEVLLSDFSPRSPWSLSFGGMAKRRGEQGLVIEVPTLAPAEEVLRAIARLRLTLGVEDVKRMGMSPRLAKQMVNQRFSGPVAARCEEHFADLIPVRSDREGLYSHMFRAVYATIAAHWFCPPWVPEHSFKAEIQGHFTLTADGRKLPSFGARANYDDYAIGTVDGNRDGRLGIKLGELPGLRVIEVFRREKDKVEDGGMVVETGDEDVIMGKLSDSNQSRGKLRRLEVQAEDWERLVALMEQRGVVGSPRQMFRGLLEVVEAEGRCQMQTIQEVARTFNWFTGRVDALEQSCRDLQEECDRLKEAQERDGEEQVDGEVLARLGAENEGLRRELEETRSRLAAIQQLLGGEGSRLVAPGDKDKIEGSGSKGAEVRGRRAAGETEEKLHRIVDALLAWNADQDRAERRLRISIPAIKGLASAMGANYQKVIQAVLQQREEELAAHHSQLMIGVRHNATVRGKDELLQDIARDYLELENWGEVRF